MNITKQHILDWLKAFAAVIAEKKDYLTELDAAIGDADHGINLHRGFQKVNTQSSELEARDLSGIFKAVSMTLISTVGGASGPLYGTFFLRGSTAIAGKEELTATELGDLLQAGVAGVIQRGKANLGDKTMLDVLLPAVEHFIAEIQKGDTLVDALDHAVRVAQTAMEQTIPLIAKKGRASYLGERSIGHQDPGATSSYLLLKTLLETITVNAATT